MRFFGVGAAVVVLVTLAAGLAGYASAQEGDGDDARPRAELRERFRERVAANLGVTPDELEQAFKEAALQGVDEALAAGRITEQQAETMRERIESGDGLRGAHRRHHQRMHNVRAAIVESAATAIGITPDDLRAELRAGNSIGGVADAHGVTRDAVKAQITSDATAKLADRVAAGAITQEQADAALAKLTQRLDDILDRTHAGGPMQQAPAQP
jgi:hypothetical protein